MKTTSPYKTAEELGIEQWEHDGLVALIRPLSRRELDLDMNYATHPHHICGTVCCIGGHMVVRTGVLDRSMIWTYVERLRSDALHDLFYPSVINEQTGDYDIRDGALAARAIVNFLTLGDPSWDDVMREPA